MGRVGRMLGGIVTGGPRVVDLCAGPGGWDRAAMELGLHPIGVEVDPDACQTRALNGLTTVPHSVATLDPERFAPVAGLIASPPCPSFSQAGKREGVDHLDDLIAAIERQEWAWRPHTVGALDLGPSHATDPNIWLSLEVGRWAETLLPDWIVCEQVPPALILWETFADLFREWGYHAWSGVLNAADYGVPQSRKRAVLIASRGHAVGEPSPTHAEGGAPGRLPWVSAAAALGLDAVEINTGLDWKPGGDRSGAQTIDGKERPAPTVTAHSGGQWHLGSDAIMLTVEQAAALQDFPTDHRFAGTRSDQFQQIGNAVPRAMARAVLTEALDGQLPFGDTP